MDQVLAQLELQANAEKYGKTSPWFVVGGAWFVVGRSAFAFGLRRDRPFPPTR